MRTVIIYLLAVSALVAVLPGCVLEDKRDDVIIAGGLRGKLEGRSVLLVMAGDGYRDEEVYITRDRLSGAGAEVTIAGPTTDEAQAAITGSIVPDLAIADVTPSEYSAVIFTGWAEGPGLGEDAIALAAATSSAGIVVGGINQGIGILEQAGVVKTLEGATSETTDEAATEEPVTDEAATEEPVTDEVATEEPVTDEAATEEPVTDEVATEEPVTDEETEDQTASLETTAGAAERAVPPTEEQLADEDAEIVTVLRDGLVVTALGPRDAPAFAGEIVLAVREAEAAAAEEDE